MNLPFNVRVGNIVEYSGPLGHHGFVNVRSINPFDDTRQVYILEPQYAGAEQFAGYTEHIRPIFLTETHLTTLGFELDLQSKRFSKQYITIASFGYSEGNDPFNMTYVFLGYRIISADFPDIPTM
jgi:hypothetical protein